MKHIYILLIILVCSVSVMFGYIVMNNGASTSAASDDNLDEVIAVESPAPEPAKETETPSLYELKRIGGAAVMYPRVPLMDMNFRPRRYDIQPGAYFPGLEGVKLEEAIHIVATTFPMLNVRAIPDGFPVDLEVRRDRVTVIIDPATNYVMDARIG